jgi:UDP-3-O-[3-hydroxymyristoyl] glucosamine N-acyltransferase
MPHEISIKAQAVVPRLPELRQQVRELVHRVAALEARETRARRGSKKSKGKGKK